MEKSMIKNIFTLATSVVASVLIFCVSVSANEPDEILPYSEQGELRKMVSVIETDTPPVIDGIMDPGEWDRASAITGLAKTSMQGRGRQYGTWGLDNMAEVQSTFRITYDENYLYIAHHSPPPENIKDAPQIIAVMLKSIITQHDSNIDWDDSISVSIVHPEYPGGDQYIIQVNSIGTTFDCIWGGGHNHDGTIIAWDPEIISASTLTLEGWTIEMAVSWEDMGKYINKPAPGQVLHMNFARFWREVINENHAWKATNFLNAGVPRHLKPAGEVKFQGAEGIVVDLKDTGNLPRGQASFTADITNFYSSEKGLSIEIITDSGELSDKRIIKLPAGEKATYEYQGQIADFATTKIALVITEEGTEEEIHITTLPVIRPSEPELFVRRYRSRELSKIEADISFIGGADLKRTTILMTLTDKDTGRRALRQTYRGFNSYQPTLEFSTEKLEPGDYTANFIINAPGMKNYETSIHYRHPELPEWWNNRYGYEDMDSDKVPYPWIDMAIEEDTVKVWGREYIYGRSILPEQITTLGRPMLKAPARILIKTAGGETIDTSLLEAESEWTKKDRTRVEGVRSITGDTLSLKNSFWTEYDGIVWNKLTIDPAKNIDITSMVLEIPLNREFTELINSMDYSLRSTGKINPEGFSDEPTRRVWLGNSEGGIQWLCETNGRFFVKDMRSGLSIKVEDNTATLYVTMIDIPTNFNSPHDIEFGLIATPVRPNMKRTPYFRASSVRGGGPWYPKGLEFMPAADPGHNFYNSGRIYVHVGPVNIKPETDVAGMDDSLFSDEWLANPNERVVRASITQSSKSMRDYFVWRHWRYQQKYGYAGLYYDGASPVASTNLNANAGHMRRDGTLFPTHPILGARDIVKRLYNITLSNTYFGAREQAIGFHESAMPKMFYMGFGTYHWDSENYNSIINQQQQTYRGVTDPAMFRAQHMGYNQHGLPTFFLGQGRIREEWLEPNGGPEAVFDQIYGLNLLHDGNGVCCIMPRGGVTRELQTRRVSDFSTLNLHHWKYQFTPYWRQDIVKLPEDDMYASFYIARPSRLVSVIDKGSLVQNRALASYINGYEHLPGYVRGTLLDDFRQESSWIELLEDKAVIVVYNDSEWEGEMRLDVDWQKIGIGLPEELKAVNYLHSTGFKIEKGVDDEGVEIDKAVFFNRPEEFAKIEDGHLVFPMTKYNYRLILIEKK